MLTNFDYIIFGVLTISLLIGFVRGFVRELLGLVSWIAAGWAMIYLTPILQEEFFKDTSAVGQVGIGIGIAIIVLIVMTCVIFIITNKIRTSPLNMLDRFLGLLFGICRGCVLILAVYFALDLVTPEIGENAFNKQTGATAPLVIASGTYIKGKFPEFFKKVEEAKDQTSEKVKERVEQAKKDGKDAIGSMTGGAAIDSLTKDGKKENLQKKLNSPEVEKKKKGTSKKDYTDRERSAMDKLISSHND